MKTEVFNNSTISLSQIGMIPIRLGRQSHTQRETFIYQSEFLSWKPFGSLIKYKNNNERLILTTLLSNFSRKEFIMVIMLDSNFITRGSVFVCFLLFLLQKLSMKRKKTNSVEGNHPFTVFSIQLYSLDNT